MAKYLIKNSFCLAARQSLIFSGEILEGSIKTGQTLTLPSAWNRPEFSLKITGVVSESKDPGRGLVDIAVTPVSGDFETLSSLQFQNIEAETREA